MSSQTLAFNGVDGATGAYLYPPRTVRRSPGRGNLGHSQLKPRKASSVALRERRRRSVTAFGPRLGPRQGIDPTDLAAAGWGVVFARDADPAIREALGELLTHRRRQTRHYREFGGEDGYRPGESKLDFLRRHRVGPGPADPAKVPYYLLLVGDPRQMPYGFQHLLSVQYAVGRLHFDTPEEYAAYASSVVEAETHRAQARRRAVFFGVRNPDDQATEQTARYLVERSADYLVNHQPAWKVESVLAEAADKARLSRLLGGDETPDFLFTACHGLGYPADDRRQLRCQGALLCQDWPGPQVWHGPIDEDHYLAAADVAADARLRGLITFHFACHGAGTPRLETRRPEREPRVLAPYPFVARLPQRLLGHPRGGALAVISHVGRAWGYSFIWRGAGAQPQVFQDAIKRLLEGHPVGSAMEPFNLRYAELCAELHELREGSYGELPEADELAVVRTAANDARNYVILGDPAVRLP